MAYVHTIRSTMKGIVSYCQKRDEQIVKFRQKGWSLSDLASKYNITEQRVGQIVAKSAKRISSAGRRRKAS
jgi:Mor family transcriptional regulator